MDVKDLRASERYVVVDQLVGSYGAASVSILDIGERGLQIEHAQPLRLATSARLWFKHESLTVSFQGAIVWSHLSKKPNSRGKYLYHSGIRIDQDAMMLTDALRELTARGVLELDRDSLERKKERLEERNKVKQQNAAVKVLRSDGDPQQILMIQQAVERLKGHPDEAAKWYNRAKFALTQDTSAVAREAISHKADVLAVWEYLERSVPLGEIVRVFEKKGSF